MKKMTLAAILGFLLGYGTFVRGQNPPVTNLAGAPFPMVQWTPTEITGQKQTSDMTSKNSYVGNVEIRRPASSCMPMKRCMMSPPGGSNCAVR